MTSNALPRITPAAGGLYATITPDDTGAGELVHPRDLKAGDRFLVPYGDRTLVLDVVGDRVPSRNRLLFLATSGDRTGWMIFDDDNQQVQRYAAA